MNDILRITLLSIGILTTILFHSCSIHHNNTYDFTKNNPRTHKHVNRKYTNKTSTSSLSTKKNYKSALRHQIADNAKNYVGIPYLYGGKNPSGFDCSGFTTYVYQSNAVNLFGNTNAQSHQGNRISLRQAQKGDLLFFGDTKKISHVAIIIENSSDKLVVTHATSSKGVITQNIKGSEYWTPKILYAVDVLSKNNVIGD